MQDLVRLTGIPYVTLWRYENQGRLPYDKPEDVEKIAVALGTTVQNLLSSFIPRPPSSLYGNLMPLLRAIVDSGCEKLSVEDYISLEKLVSEHQEFLSAELIKGLLQAQDRNKQ